MGGALLGWLLAGMLAPRAEPVQGLKIVTVEGEGGATTQVIRYVADDRSRVEYLYPPAMHSASITRCDRQSSFFLNYIDKSFVRSGQPNYLSAAFRASRRKAVATSDGPPEVIETRTVQTGEQKTMFGFTARRVATTTRRIKADGTVDGVTETDGWYIDLETRPTCERTDSTTATFLVGVVSTDGRLRIPRIEIKNIGARERGFPIDTTSRFRQDGHSSTSRTVVRELTQGPLDPELFEIPPDFHDAQGISGWLNAQAVLVWETMSSLFRNLWR
jgi:hypothetical protein